ncbi:MAG: GNAT family N-acetyltransferase [Chloroflexi bacterium HGW-Chloroflexi-10]|nr:MAG: GNAT family N-acetyltransferase [Chloroflexi bacterium HGW-Chloroflexi-10]
MALNLETPRLILRSFQMTDVDVFAAYRSDPEIAEYQGWEAPYSRAQAVLFIEEMNKIRPGTPGEWYQLAITLKEDGRMLGDCAFYVMAEDERQAEIGFTLAKENHGKGFATEAVTRLLAYLFEDLNLHRVRAICDVENTDSFKVMERVGMRREAHFIEHLWYKNRWSSEYWFAILQSEWNQRAKP